MRTIPITGPADAQRRIQAHDGLPEEFPLPISNMLLELAGVNTRARLVAQWVRTA